MCHDHLSPLETYELIGDDENQHTALNLRHHLGLTEAEYERLLSVCGYKLKKGVRAKWEAFGVAEKTKVFRVRQWFIKIGQSANGSYKSVLDQMKDSSFRMPNLNSSHMNQVREQLR